MDETGDTLPPTSFVSTENDMEISDNLGNNGWGGPGALQRPRNVGEGMRPRAATRAKPQTRARTP